MSTFQRKAEEEEIRHSQELEKKWKCPVECTPRINWGVFGAHPSPLLLLTLKLVAVIPCACPTVMRNRLC